MPHALILSYYFPPRFNVGGKRMDRFCRHLPGEGWSTTVVTAAPHPEERLDPSTPTEPPCPVLPLWTTPEEAAARAWTPYGSDGTITAPTRHRPARSKLLSALGRMGFKRPVGPELGEVPRIAGRIVAGAAEPRPDVVLATGAPWEVVVAGARVAEALDVPLVADLRDPWTMNPIQAGRPFLTRALDKAFERRTLGRAAMVLLTAETARDAYRARFPDHPRIECVRNSFDAPGTPAPAADERFTLVHFGNCYWRRDLGAFLRAFALFVERAGDAAAAAGARLLNLGRVAQVDLDLAAELGLGERFEHMTFLPYREGLELVRASAGAVLPVYGGSPLFLPAKLYDYLAAGVPILATDASRELRGILDATRAGWVEDVGDIEALAARMLALFEAHQTGNRAVEPDPAAVAALEARAVTRELAELLGAVV